jgi:hypothetical protein
MGKFLESEKTRQALLVPTSLYLSKKARGGGVYRSKHRFFCLPIECAEENLFPDIRTRVLTYFNANHIKWHDGWNGNPSHHLCDSQVCCINFLFPFADKPDALAKVLRSIFPNIQVMLPMEEGLYVVHEWIGKDDYLREKKEARNKKRSRGANCTSVDAAVMFERTYRWQTANCFD